MSVRTIVEFNHDLAHRIECEPDRFMMLLGQALRGGSPEEWDKLDLFYGVRRAVMCHHSDDRKAVVNGHEYRIG